METFFSLCPGATDRDMQFFLAKDPRLLPKVAADLRARLEKERDPKRLEDYSTLWGLEFRTRLPAEHGALRTQIGLDLKRMKRLHPNGDAEWQAFVINGYKQSGVSKAEITVMEDRILRQIQALIRPLRLFRSAGLKQIQSLKTKPIRLDGPSTRSSTRKL